MSKFLEQERAKWRRWLSLTFQNVADVADNRFIFRRLREMTDANPMLRRRSYFYDWVSQTYVHYAAMAIRRELKVDKNSTSFKRLLSQIADRPEAFPEQYFLNPPEGTKVADPRVQRFYAEQGRALFANYSGSDGSFSSELVRKDLEALEAACELVEEYADKLIAHRDKKPPKRVTRLGDVDQAIDQLLKLYSRYNLLLNRGDDPYEPAKHVDPRWDELFTYPWSERVPPN